MPKISTSIELYDNFSNSLYNIIGAVQTATLAMQDLANDMSTDVDTSAFDNARASLDKATMSVRRFEESLNNISDTGTPTVAVAAEKANIDYQKLNNTVNQTDEHIRANVAAQENFNDKIELGAHKADSLMETIKKAVLAYGTFQTVKNIINLSDDITSMTARLNLMNDGLQTTEELQNMIFASAERSRGSYLATADAVSKLGLMAGDAFNSSAEIIAFSEQLNKQFTIAGTSAEGIDAAMLQLTQAMGSGILRGEEFNSVLEQAPNIIQAIADYMNVPKGQLKDMAAEGMITAEIVKNAMFAAAEETNRQFESMPMTFSQAWQSFENRSIKIFEPVLKQLNRLVNNDGFEKSIDGIMTALSVLATIALITFNVLASMGGFVADNWSIIAPIIYLVAGALSVYYGRLALLWALEKARFVFQKTQKGVEIALAIAAYGLATARGVEASATATATAAQLGLNAAMYACPITWIVAGIAAIVAILYVGVAIVNKFAGTSISATGLIAGAFAWLGTSIINTFIGLQNIIAAFVNFFANVFTHPILSVKMAFLDLMMFIANIVRHAISLIESLINIIPGVEVDLTSKIDAQISWMQNERQATLEQGQYKEYMKPLEYRDQSEAFNRWYDKGANFAAGKTIDVITPDMGQYNLDAITNGIGTIAENTSQTADNTAMTDEDLKYMRDIAEQEVINRYTTAEINVDMSGMQNTVNNNGDLDGFMSGLTDAVNEAAESMAEGTHE